MYAPIYMTAHFTLFSNKFSTLMYRNRRCQLDNSREFELTSGRNLTTKGGGGTFGRVSGLQTLKN